MSLDPQKVSQEFPEQILGSLRGCLVEGDSEQRKRERHVRRRALALSIVLQSAVLVALVLVPLFGKTGRIASANMTPIPPYSPYHHAAHPPGSPAPPHFNNGPQNVCHFCTPPNIPPTIPTRDPLSSGNDLNERPFEGVGVSIPGAPDGIPLADARQKVRVQEEVEDHHAVQRHVLHVTHLDPAMLIHRIEPAYPSWAKQMHREGRVELRAIIATDGTIQSLQAVAGDPLFFQSALEAVLQWRYTPTILNGQSVEIDTYITVIYSMQH